MQMDEKPQNDVQSSNNIQKLPNNNSNGSLGSQPNLAKIAYSHLIFNENKKLQNIMSHCRVVYDSMVFLLNLSEDLKSQLQKTIPQRLLKLADWNEGNKVRKTLLVDLDETLIKANCVASPELTQCMDISGSNVWFSIRPGTYEFLAKMSSIFQIVLFTTAHNSYAQAFFNILNSRSGNAIQQVISREGCIYIFKSIFFKDLRVISNRSLQSTVLLDNSPVTFGVLPDNGIPILSYDCDPEDQELLWVMNYLKKLNEAEDVRVFNRENLNLRSILGVTKTTIVKT